MLKAPTKWLLCPRSRQMRAAGFSLAVYYHGRSDRYSSYRFCWFGSIRIWEAEDRLSRRRVGDWASSLTGQESCTSYCVNCFTSGAAMLQECLRLLFLLLRSWTMHMNLGETSKIQILQCANGNAHSLGLTGNLKVVQYCGKWDVCSIVSLSIAWLGGTLCQCSNLSGYVPS